jgi:hypothetical protein
MQAQCIRHDALDYVTVRHREPDRPQASGIGEQSVVLPDGPDGSSLDGSQRLPAGKRHRGRMGLHGTPEPLA